MSRLRRKYPLRKRAIFNLHSKYVRTQAKLHDLNYFFWECTSRCNISCLHCGSDCKIVENVPDMPAEDFLNVCSQVAKRYNPNKVMIVVSGGEPLVRKDLEEVGTELMKMGFPWGMVSNGYAMTPERFRSLRNAGLRSATISLDGLKANHDWLRGKEGSFERAANAIKLLVAEPNMVYDVVTCVNHRNFEEAGKIKDFLIELGVKRWRIFMIDPIGRAAQNPELMLDNEKFRAVFDFILRTRAEGKIKVATRM